MSAARFGWRLRNFEPSPTSYASISPAFSYGPLCRTGLERKAIIEEFSVRFSPEEIEQMLQHVSQRQLGFLFVDLKTTDPERMFQDSLLQYLRPSD